MLHSHIKPSMIFTIIAVLMVSLIASVPARAAETINFGTQPATMPIYIARSMGLLDEIEKAHPDVFNLLLQVLDDGRLTDSHGRTVDFRHCVIIMTSNLGSDLIQTLSSEDDYAQMKSALMERVAQHFRPEFLNRVDDSVVFHPLLQEHMSGIIKIQLERLKKRLHERNISLRLTEKAIEFLAEVGYDPVYGARPLKRAIQKELETELARAILSGEIQEGQEVTANASAGKIFFEKITPVSKDE